MIAHRGKQAKAEALNEIEREKKEARNTNIRIAPKVTTAGLDYGKIKRKRKKRRIVVATKWQLHQTMSRALNVNS